MKILICGPMDISDELIEKYRSNYYIIAADSGYDRLIEFGIKPDLIIGDLDSVKSKEILCEKIEYDSEKDFSDLEAAVDYSLSNFSAEIDIIGVSGGRIDHFLSAIFLLRKSERIRILDENNICFYRKGDFVIERQEDCYFSVFPIIESKISIKGAKYNLDSEYMNLFSSRMTSNEFVDDDVIVESEGESIIVVTKKFPLKKGI